MSLELEAKMSVENGSYLMLVNVKVKAPELLETEEEKTYSLLYKNGILLGIYDEDGKTYVTGTDVNFVTPMSFEVYWKQLEQAFNLADPQIAGALLAAREMLAEYLPICGSTVNAALAAANSEYTAEQLIDLLDEIENVYAYAALKMGFTSIIAMNKDEIEQPKLAVFQKLIDRYMIKTENDDGSVTYVLDEEKLETEVTEALDVIEETVYKPLSELIYGLIDEKLTETYPELTDWNACYEKFCESFAGSMTVKDAINRLIPILEASEICTLEELYDMINQIAVKQTGDTEFNIKALINEYRDMSIDDLVVAMTEDEDMTAENFYEMLNGMLSEMTLDDLLRMQMGSEGNSSPDHPNGGENGDAGYGEPGISYPVDRPDASYPVEKPEVSGDKDDTIVKNEVSYNADYTYGEFPGGANVGGNVTIGGGSFEMNGGNVSMEGSTTEKDEPVEDSEVNEISIGMLLEQLDEILNMIDVETALTYTLDADGKLISLNFSETAAEADDGDDTTEAVIMEQAAITVLRDATITIEIPEIMNPALQSQITTSYDAQGNLIIKGLDPNYNYSFNIYGHTITNLAEVAEKHDAMSAEMGYPVYVLPKGLWEQSQPVLSVIQIGDKYYEYELINRAGDTYIPKSEKLSDVLGNPMDYVPEDTDPVVGYYNYGGMEIPVYDGWFGPMFYADGQWNIAVDYSAHLQTYVDDNENKESRYVYVIRESRGYEKLMFNAKLDMVNDDDWNDDKNYVYNGEKVHLITVTVNFNSDMPNRTCLGYYKDSVLYLVQVVTPAADWCYQLTKELTQLPEYDSESTNHYFFENANACIGLDGNPVTENYTVKMLSKRIPTYYVKADDQTVVALNSNALCKPVVSVLNETVILPSGKTMYVWKTETYEGSGRKVVYGYTKLAEDLYLQTAVEYLNGELKNVVYRDGRSDRHCSFDEIYDLRSFMVLNPDGSYTVKTELVNKLKAECTEAGDGYAFVVRGSKTVDGVEYDVSYMVGAYSIPSEITGVGGNRDEEADRGYDWEWIFGNQDGAQGYMTKINNDGSLSIFFPDGRVITNVEVHLGNRLPATTENILKPSGMTHDGLPLYSYEDTWESRDEFLYKDGKYYDYDIYNDSIATYFDDAKAMLKCFYLRSLTAQYVYKDADTGIEYLVYNGEMSIHRGGKGYYDEMSKGLNNLYFLYDHIEGTLYVLRGVDADGETIMSFEEMVTWEQYVDKLNIRVGQDEYMSHGAYLNGTYHDRYYVTLFLTEWGDNGTALLNADGNATVHSLRVCYVKDGDAKKFVRIDGYTDDVYLECDYTREIQLSNYKEINRVEKEFKGTSATVCTVVWYNTNTHYVVKLGDGFYDRDEYERFKLDEQEFQKQFKSLRKFFECNGVYYDSIEVDAKGNITLGKVLESRPSYEGPDAYTAYHHDKEQGIDVIEYGYYVDGGEKFTEELSDGTVYHYTEGCAFLELTNGYYVRAYRVGEKIYCEYMGLAAIPDSLVLESGVLDDYISLNEDQTVITVSNDALDFLADYSNDFNLYLYANGFSAYIGYNQLQNLLRGYEK